MSHAMPFTNSVFSIALNTSDDGKETGVDSSANEDLVVRRSKPASSSQERGDVKMMTSDLLRV